MSDSSIADTTESSDSEKEYIVEDIRGQRTRKGVKEYHIKWYGFPESENTWEKEENLHCPEILEKFLSAGKASNSQVKNVKAPAKKASAVIGSTKTAEGKEYLIVFEDGSAKIFSDSDTKRLFPSLLIDYLESYFMRSDKSTPQMNYQEILQQNT